MVATRFVIGQTGPASLALLRYAIGCLCLVPAVLMMRGRASFAARDVAPIAALGIVQFGLLIALLNWGLRIIPAGRGAVVFATFPLLTMMIAVALGQERLTWRRTLGVLLTIAGVALTLGGQARSEPVGPAPVGLDWAGYLAAFGAALCGAVCSVLYRPYLRRYPALQVSALAMLASVVALAVPAGLGEGFFAAWPRFTPAGWLAVVFIGMSSGIGYLLWLWALGRAAATQVTVFLSLGPVVAFLLGAALLGEPVPAPAIAGLACLAGGLWAATREPRPVAREDGR
ncbi:MAG: DMT family transporter [Rhodospirillales bacterium]|nr:DMT family transporter [Rhodospirillales bacterium]MDE2200275.1 DMT family transporter [Rhodospirillales bacterium]MDE2576197.1 DMT family transporter [Rhodospirillales bacterium]